MPFIGQRGTWEKGEERKMGGSGWQSGVGTGCESAATTRGRWTQVGWPGGGAQPPQREGAGEAGKNWVGN
jgi:hypothetical protein